jgi:hypothetical protein
MDFTRDEIRNYFGPQIKPLFDRSGQFGWYLRLKPNCGWDMDIVMFAKILKLLFLVDVPIDYITFGPVIVRSRNEGVWPAKNWNDKLPGTTLAIYADLREVKDD